MTRSTSTDGELDIPQRVLRGADALVRHREGPLGAQPAHPARGGGEHGRACAARPEVLLHVPLLPADRSVPLGHDGQRPLRGKARP